MALFGKKEESQEQGGDLVETLKERGISCKKLRKMETESYSDAKLMRDAGFIQIAAAEESIAEKVKALRRKICLLK